MGTLMKGAWCEILTRYFLCRFEPSKYLVPPFATPTFRKGEVNSIESERDVDEPEELTASENRAKEIKAEADAAHALAKYDLFTKSYYCCISCLFL
jgi:hypothetical protein